MCYRGAKYIFAASQSIKVHVNVEKAQERQQKAYKKRIKKGTKRFKVLPGMVVLKKDERKRGRPGRTMDPDWPTQYR